MHDGNIVVSDTSCLILLTKIDAIEILQKLYSRVVTTSEIALEHGDPLPEWIEILELTDFAFRRAIELHVDKGEASAIALAREIGAILILDDLKARRVARFLNMKFTGTLGVLGKAKSNGIIPLLKPVVEKLLQTNFRISPIVVEELLAKHGE